MSETRFGFATVEEAVDEIRQGRMIVLVDDEDRENEGDLTLAAEKITPEAINFMAKFGRGLICLALTEQRCDELNLPLMSPINTSGFRSRDYHFDGDRSEDPAAGPRAARAHVPTAGAEWRRAGSRGADGSERGPVAHRGPQSLRCDLRNHE